MNKKVLISNNFGSCSTILPYTTHQVDFAHFEDTTVATFISFYTDFLTDRGYKFSPYAKSFATFQENILLVLSSFPGIDKDENGRIIREIMSEFLKHREMSFEHISDLLAEFFTKISHRNNSAANTSHIAHKNRWRWLDEQ